MSSKHFAFALVTSVLLGFALADKADDNVAACCRKEGVDAYCCKHRPGSAPLSESSATSSMGCYSEEGFPKFVHCAAGGLDNTGCCKAANVTEPLCLELCDGTRPISHSDTTEYARCSWVRPKIAKCNHDASDN
ncbi:hypothetical protein AAVH_25454 [Aphelenchoides avenae]|nr:hypothetical protein AAVH_25454 [Aphelenchus avenae]